jgi:hypothetical protein
LPDVLADIEDNTGRNPNVLSADRGYSLKEGLHDLKERGIDGYIPQRREGSGNVGHDQFKREDFVYDTKTDTYRCPNGRTLHFNRNVSIEVRQNSFMIRRLSAPDLAC